MDGAEGVYTVGQAAAASKAHTQGGKLTVERKDCLVMRHLPHLLALSWSGDL